MRLKNWYNKATLDYIERLLKQLNSAKTTKLIFIKNIAIHSILNLISYEVSSVLTSWIVSHHLYVLMHVFQYRFMAIPASEECEKVIRRSSRWLWGAMLGYCANEVCQHFLKKFNHQLDEENMRILFGNLWSPNVHSKYGMCQQSRGAIFGVGC